MYNGVFSDLQNNHIIQKEIIYPPPEHASSSGKSALVWYYLIKNKPDI